MNDFEIVVFKQKINKEDKKSYDLLSTKSFLNGQETVKKTNINTFKYITSVLANTDVINVVGHMADFNFKSNDEKETLSGIFKVISICITPRGEYVTAYVLQKKGAFSIHKEVQAPKLVIKPDGSIIF